MDRLTHERSNGIKTGYWSPNKKDELVQALAAYENTGLAADEIKGLVDDVIYVNRQLMREWIPVEERLPKTDDDVLITARNGIVSCAWYNAASKLWFGLMDETVNVIAWMPLPERYRP